MRMRRRGKQSTSVYRTGRPAIKTSPKKVREVEKTFSENPSLSIPAAARKLNFSSSAAAHNKLNKLGLRTKLKVIWYVVV
jgi:hypothetical protein